MSPGSGQHQRHAAVSASDRGDPTRRPGASLEDFLGVECPKTVGSATEGVSKLVWRALRCRACPCPGGWIGDSVSHPQQPKRVEPHEQRHSPSSPSTCRTFTPRPRTSAWSASPGRATTEPPSAAQSRHESRAGVARFASGFVAGPSRISPSTLNREPWHGQSQLRSAAFHATWQPRCVQRAETACSSPSSSR
jgi:hypothetical protein